MNPAQITPELIRAAIYPVQQLMPYPTAERKTAAVLMPLLLRDNTWQVMYIKRTSHNGTHQGQVAFPGGGYEPEDQDMTATMYREVYEEVGLTEGRIELLGRLDYRFTTSSKYNIIPFVGVIDSLENLTLSDLEVERLLIIPLTWLADAGNYVEEWMHDELGQPVMTFRYHPFQGEILWGITASMTQNFISLVNRIQ